MWRRIRGLRPALTVCRVAPRRCYAAEWEQARALLEQGRVEDAHATVVDAIGAALKVQQTEPQTRVTLPLLVLELGKSLLKQTESQDAHSAFTHAVEMFEDVLAEPEPGMDEGLLRQRYIETLLHFAKLCYLMGQLPECEHLWKKSISHAVKHAGRESYDVLVASNGLSEFYLEQLRLKDAERFTGASIELSKTLLAKAKPQEVRALRERLSEALTMAGLARVQTQDWAGGERYYREALSHVETLEREAGGTMDDFTKVAFFNLYRNLEHMYRGRGDEAHAEEVVKTRLAKLGVYEDVTLEEQPQDEESGTARRQ